jgi:signal transduction histidine kinase
MQQAYSQKLWIPYLLAILGIICSLLFSFLLWKDINDYIAILLRLHTYVAWLVLVAGIGISILIAVIIRMAQTARQQSFTFFQMNEDLKNEIIERSHAEQSKQQMEAALLQGQKLQAMGTLASGIAHDFNNILYAIIGYVEMARDDVDHQSIIYQNLGKVLDGAHRGQELVARILAFSRRQHQGFDVINVDTTIESVLALLRPTIPASVMIFFEANVDLLILGNQTQIHQVMINLINNAVDAMDGEGSIHITVSRIKPNDAVLKEFPETKQQNYCKINITDTGHGMDEHTVARVFEPFYTTKEVGKGTGLGLSIVHSIIKEHKGEIKIESELGKGTQFIILLPEYLEQ